MHWCAPVPGCGLTDHENGFQCRHVTSRRLERVLGTPGGPQISTAPDEHSTLPTKQHTSYAGKKPTRGVSAVKTTPTFSPCSNPSLELCLQWKVPAFKGPVPPSTATANGAPRPPLTGRRARQELGARAPATSGESARQRPRPLPGPPGGRAAGQEEDPSRELREGHTRGRDSPPRLRTSGEEPGDSHAGGVPCRGYGTCARCRVLSLQITQHTSKYVTLLLPTALASTYMKFSSRSLQR